MHENPKSQEVTVLEYFQLLTYIFIPSDLGIEIPVKELRICVKEYRGLDFFILAWSKVTVKYLGGCLMSPTVNAAKA